ncbi:hypothetical protein ABLB95_15290 (plasmid) [Acinetobacter radioresistens]|uniref:hypothetical protein n=1 Tax=Acinetobacter radioresistens TaxID=40216 RepID=UPI0032B4D548
MTKHDNVSQGKIMKATEFVKKHGWGETQRIIQDYPSHTHVTSDARMFINEHFCIEEIKHQLVGLVKICELKRLVESYEILGLFKSLDQAKADVAACEYAGHADLLVKLDCGIGYINTAKVKQAIADVEACQ